MKNVLVCGVSGFMGSNISKYLLENTDYNVYGVMFSTAPPVEIEEKRKFTQLFTCDLTTQKGVDHVFSYTKYDVVIQAAATTSGAKDILERPYIHVTDNAVMNSLLLRASYEHGVGQFIFLSCGVMYQPGDKPRKESDFNESDEIFPAYFGVGSMKVYIEKQMQFYSRLGRTKYLAIRHSNTYGPFDKYDYEHSHVLGATLRKVMDATNEIEVWGSGTETARDLVYVEDICELIHGAIEKQIGAFNLINAGIGTAITVKELVETIVKLSGKNLEIKYNSNKPVIPTKLSLDSTLAKTLFDWVAKTNLEEGVRKTLNWYINYYGK